MLPVNFATGHDSCRPEKLGKQFGSCRLFRKVVELRCSTPIVQPYTVTTGFPQQRSLRMSMYIGEALVGEGNEIAHIDLLDRLQRRPGRRGVRQCPGQSIGRAFESAGGHHAEPLCKPATVLITKVTIKGAKQAVQMFGPAQAAVARAVADCTAAGIIPQHLADNLVIVCGVFIHWQAKDDAKIFQYNYEATKIAIKNAMKGEPKLARDHGPEGKGQASVFAEIILRSSFSAGPPPSALRSCFKTRGTRFQSCLFPRRLHHWNGVPRDIEAASKRIHQVIPVDKRKILIQLDSDRARQRLRPRRGRSTPAPTKSSATAASSRSRCKGWCMAPSSRAARRT